jgi:hypothetical protein
VGARWVRIDGTGSCRVVCTLSDVSVASRYGKAADWYTVGPASTCSCAGEGQHSAGINVGPDAAGQIHSCRHIASCDHFSPSNHFEGVSFFFMRGPSNEI